MNAVFVSLLLATVTTGTNADLCSTNNGGCSAQATCSTNYGFVSCACKPGYSGDGKTCLQNMAFGKSAMSSSTYQKAVATLALDGDLTTTACTDTDATKTLTNWWAVDLGSAQTISVVTVTNDVVDYSTTSQNHRLDYFKVGWSNTEPTIGKSITDFTLCQQYSGTVSPGGTYNIPCPTGTSARYVIVQSNRADGTAMCLTDVAVLGAIPTLGCFVELNTRDMNGDSKTDPAMTVEMCISYCRTTGWLFAGAQNANACYCANKYGNYGRSAGCNKPCVGNSAQICGGTTSSSVYPTGLVTLIVSGTDTTAAVLTCPSPKKIYLVNAKYVAGTTCNADKKSSVESSCRAQASCSVKAAYTPDPCAGLSPKSLVVQYYCWSA